MNGTRGELTPRTRIFLRKNSPMHVRSRPEWGPQKKEGEKDRLVLLVQGRDDLLLSAYLR